MSLLVSNIRLPFDRPEEEAMAEARRLTGLRSEEIQAAVYRVSVDARRGHIARVYTVRLDAPWDEKAFAETLQMPFVRYKPDEKPTVPRGSKRLEHRPVVIGLGPAGLFAAYTLAKYGYAPLVLERGGALEERDRAVDTFWSGGALDTNCNIQFGEGGAGAYSDGKLTTRIGDPLCDTVLQTLAAHGAPSDIVKKAKPHVGTDILKNVVRAMRCAIIQNGGEVRFRTALTGVTLCCVRCRRAAMPFRANGQWLRSDIPRGIPLQCCTKTGYTLSQRRFRSACGSSTCKANWTVRCMGNTRGIRCCRRRSITCPAARGDGPAIPSACARAAWWSRRRARKTPL